MKTDSMLVAMFYALGPMHLSNFGLKYEKRNYSSCNIQFLDVKFIPYHVAFIYHAVFSSLSSTCTLVLLFFYSQ